MTDVLFSIGMSFFFDFGKPTDKWMIFPTSYTSVCAISGRSSRETGGKDGKHRHNQRDTTVAAVVRHKVRSQIRIELLAKMESIDRS